MFSTVRKFNILRLFYVAAAYLTAEGATVRPVQSRQAVHVAYLMNDQLSKQFALPEPPSSATAAQFQMYLKQLWYICSC